MRSYAMGRNISTAYSRSTCELSSSKGVLRPKILTDTLSFFFYLLTSSTMPVKPLNGPSLTLTVSPTI